MSRGGSRKSESGNVGLDEEEREMSSSWSVSGGVRTYPEPGLRVKFGFCLWLGLLGSGERVCSWSFCVRVEIERRLWFALPFGVWSSYGNGTEVGGWVRRRRKRD